MGNPLLFPSMMCANFQNLEKEISELEKAEVDGYHIDIMDGKFVPNFGMGLQDISAIRKLTNRMIDVHLMIEGADQYIQLFTDMGVDLIYVHFEATKQLSRVLQKIKEKDLFVGLAINPETALCSIEDVLPLIDYLLVMTVNPGFSGQNFLEYVEKKIQNVVDLRKVSNNSFKMVVDGAISEEKLLRLSKIGVDGFVLGTSGLFNVSSSTYRNTIQSLRKKVHTI